MVCAQEVDPQIKRILEDWKRRQANIKTARYVFEGTIRRPQESVNHDAKNKKNAIVVDKDVVLKDKGTILMEFSSNRFRLERQEDIWHVQKGIEQVAGTLAFDGKERWSGARVLQEGKDVTRPGTPDLTVGTFNPENLPMDLRFLPIFAGHGIMVISGRDQILPGKWQVEPETALLTVHGESAFDNRRHLILRTHPIVGDTEYFKEFWIDPARDSAVVRIIEYQNKNPEAELSVQYQKTPQGWLAKEWSSVRRFWFKGSKAFLTDHIASFQVKSLVINPAVAERDFQLEIRPGMLIRRTDKADPVPKTPKDKTPGPLFRSNRSLQKTGAAAGGLIS